MTGTGRKLEAGGRETVISPSLSNLGKLFCYSLFPYLESFFFFFHIALMIICNYIIGSVQTLSHVQLFATPWTTAHQVSCPLLTLRIYPNPCPLSHDAIHRSHPLSSPSAPTFNLSQHQGLFKLVSSLHQVAKVLEFQLQHQSFHRTPRADLL